MSWETSYAEIEQKYLQYVKAWETRELDVLDDIVVETPVVEYSIFLPIYGRAALKEELKKLTKQPTYSRFTTMAYTCLIENGKAQQSAGLIGYFGDDSKKEYSHYAFTGYLVNTWEQFEDGWKMTDMKFDLCTDDGSMGMRNEKNEYIRVKGAGDLDFVSHWIPIQETNDVYDGCRLRSICGDLDAPWLVIKNPENKPDDARQIQELLNRYTFMIDTGTYALLPDLFTEDASISLSQLGEMTYRTGVKMLKQMSGVGIRMHHMGQITDLVIDGDFAKSGAIRRAADEMYPYSYSKETEKTDFVAARYSLMFRKNNGKWRISHMSYFPGTYINGSYE